jgi:hypothetical protein
MYEPVKNYNRHQHRIRIYDKFKENIVPHSTIKIFRAVKPNIDNFLYAMTPLRNHDTKKTSVCHKKNKSIIISP